ncbi:TlpA family protein disulfide reductase [Coprobacter sp.]
MKKIVTAWFLFVMAAFAAYSATPSLVYIPLPVKAGSQTKIVYHPENTPLKGESDINGIVYFWQDYTWIGEDLIMSRTDTGWIATVNVPENAALVTFKFTANGKTDIGGGNTYSQLTQDSEGRNLPSGFTGWGLLRGASSQEFSIPGYMTDTTAMIGDQVLLFWYNQEIKNNPKERKNIFPYAAETLNHMNPGKMNHQILGDFTYLFQLDSVQRLPEEVFVKCRDIAGRILHNDTLARNLDNLMLKRFPKGIMVRDNEIWRLFRISDPKQKEKELKKFLKRFPTKDFVNVHTEKSDLYYGKLFQSVIYNQIVKNNNYKLLYEYIHDVPYEYLQTFYWHIVQIPYRNGQMTAANLLPHAMVIMDEILNRPRKKDQLCYSPKEWKERIYDRNREAILVHARILNEMGSVAEAFEWLQKVKPYFSVNSADFSTFYVKMLEKTGQKSEIIPFVEAGVKENAASPEMFEILKREYVSKKGSDQGFDIYVNGLKSSEKLKEQQEKIKEELVNKPIQLFAVDALDGRRIDMGAMKGKIIVLDFWATWCAPCKAAMPGMQMAVRKYKDDDKVKFYFVSTQETDPAFKEKIASFLKEKHFDDLQVVLDEPNPANKGRRDLLYSTYAKAFKFSGIPQKMIIDGDGNLRWRSTGYYGSPSALADEISFVIEYLKNEKR